MTLTENPVLSKWRCFGGEQVLWEERTHGMWLEQEQAQVVNQRGRLWKARAVGQVPDPPVTLTELTHGWCVPGTILCTPCVSPDLIFLKALWEGTSFQSFS